jgi:hypothetical protein
MWEGAPVSEHEEGRRRKGEEIWWPRSRRLKQVVLTLQSKAEDISNMTEKCKALAKLVGSRSCFELHGSFSDLQRVQYLDSDVISRSLFHMDDIFSIFHALRSY